MREGTGHPPTSGPHLALDSTKLAAELNVAQAAAGRAETERRKLEGRVERTAQAALREARARLDLARRRLDDVTVAAYFGGQVGERMADVGDHLAVGDPLFVLVDDDPLEIQFPVPERHIGEIREGAGVQIQIRSQPGRTVPGRVVFVSPVVAPESRTVTPLPATEAPGYPF